MERALDANVIGVVGVGGDGPGGGAWGGMELGRTGDPRGRDDENKAGDLPAKIDGTAWGGLSLAENGRKTNDDLSFPDPGVLSVIVCIG